MKHLLIAASIAGLAIAPAACTMRQHPVLTPTDVAYNANSKADAEAGIKQVLGNRGWIITEEKPGAITAMLSKPNAGVPGGAHTVTILVSYTADSYSIDYVDSTNMMYDPEDGTIHRNYNRWIANLQRDLSTAFVPG